MRRALAATLLVALVLAPTAAAHGGYPVLDAKQGAYAVLVQASGTTQNGEPAVDLTTYLTRQDLGEPDLGADVVLRLDTPDGARTVRPRVVGDGYEAIVAGPRDAWRDWTIEADVRGDAGQTTVRSDPAGDYGGLPGWLVPVLVALVVVGGGLSLVVVRRRLARAEEAAS